MASSGTDSSSSSFPMILLPVSPPEATGGVRVCVCVWRGARGALGGMPELNSNSPPSNSHTLSHSSNLPARVVMVARCFHTHTHTLSHTPSEGSTQAATLSPSVALLCLTFPTALLSFSLLLSHLASFLFVHCPRSRKWGIQTAGRIDRSIFVLFFFSFFFFVLKNV